MSRRFSAEMLPHDVDPEDTLYVADRDLKIVFSNEGWTRFASENRGEGLLDPGWNADLLANLRGSQLERWQNIYQLLLDGRLPYHQERMNCSSPTERRVYELRITPRRDDAGEIAWLIHHNVRVDRKPEVVDRVGRQLERLDDLENLTAAFRERIVERKIRIPCFELALHFEPLADIGGDLVWHREYPGGISDLIHADVMGHGLAAGRLAAKMAVVLDELASPELSPRQIVAGLDRSLRSIVPEDQVMFATGLSFRFEPKLQRVTCCSFAHEGPIFSRAGLVEVPTGFAVGLALTNEPWAETPLDLRELGTRFLVFSDGITEQFDADGQMFEVTGLQEAFRRHLDDPLDEMLRGIVAEWEAFRGGALVKDDQTLLALDFADGGSGGAGAT